MLREDERGADICFEGSPEVRERGGVDGAFVGEVGRAVDKGVDGSKGGEGGSDGGLGIDVEGKDVDLGGEREVEGDDGVSCLA